MTNKKSTLDDTIKTPVAQGSKTSGILKNKGEESLAKPKFDYRNLKKGKTSSGVSPAVSKSRSRSKSVKRKSLKSISPPQVAIDPR